MSDPSTAYERTGTGYRRADGEERRCVRFYLTPEQARKLKALVNEAALASPTGHLNQSDFLVDALDLDTP